MVPHEDSISRQTNRWTVRLGGDLSLAARNALLEMIDYVSETYGYTRQQAYLISSVAVDLRIGQLVDAPNVGVTAILPLDIFVGEGPAAEAAKQ